MQLQHLLKFAKNGQVEVADIALVVDMGKKWGGEAVGCDQVVVAVTDKVLPPKIRRSRGRELWA